jgi:hypothetical protein
MFCFTCRSKLDPIVVTNECEECYKIRLTPTPNKVPDEVQRIWKNAKPKVYTKSQIKDFVEKVVKEVQYNGLEFYES